MSSSPTYVFGYGSLVSRASLARTLGRDVAADRDRIPATLDGFGRRWNYGSLTKRADWEHDGHRVREGIVVSLGLVSAAETCNGVLVRVDRRELALLDRRESDYDRTDVTEHVRHDGEAFIGRVVTYVPRPGAIERFERARDDRRAAIELNYWRLVDAAFEALAIGQREAYRSLTPTPEVPVLELDVRAVRSPAR